MAIFFCHKIGRRTGAYMLVDLIAKNRVISSTFHYLESSHANHYSIGKHTLSA